MNSIYYMKSPTNALSGLTEKGGVDDVSIHTDIIPGPITIFPIDMRMDALDNR